MKRFLSGIVIFSVLCLSLCSCGKSGIEIKLGEIPIENLKSGERYCCMEGETIHSISEEENSEEGELSVNGIMCNDTLKKVIKKLGIKKGQASFDYEYDNSGDGCTEMGSEIYNGKIPDAKKLSALDLALNVYYYKENGKWKIINLNDSELSDYKDVLRVCFDAEGVHNLYGRKSGEIFMVECELLGD